MENEYLAAERVEEPLRSKRPYPARDGGWESLARPSGPGAKIIHEPSRLSSVVGSGPGCQKWVTTMGRLEVNWAALALMAR
jgi:hypothetical protein